MLLLAAAAAGQNGPTGEATEVSPVDLGIDPAVIAAATDDEGWVNYYEVYVATMTEGLTAENNGARQLVMAFGPDGWMGGWVDEDTQAAWLEALELTEENFSGDYFVEFDDYWEEHAQDVLDEKGDPLDAWDVQTDLSRGPWVDEDWPVAAAWVAENEAALDLIVEAAEAERFYLAWSGAEDDDEKSMLSMHVPRLSRVRSAAIALAIRAMHSLGEGDLVEAQRDIEAIHQLAAHTHNSAGIWLWHAVAIIAERIATQCDVALINSGLMDEDQLQQVLEANLASAPTDDLISPMLWNLREDTDILRAFAFTLRDDSPAVYAGIDWDVIRGMFEEVQGRQFAAVSGDTCLEIVTQWELLTEEIDAKREAMEMSPDEIMALAWQLDAGEIEADDVTETAEALDAQLSEMIFNMLITGFWRNMGPAIELHYETSVRRTLTATAAGCELYRLREGAYPASLDALSEAGIMDVPVDPFTGEPLQYLVDGARCVIYSVGANGEDDGGLSDRWSERMSDADLAVLGIASEDNIPEDADDITIILGASSPEESNE